MSLQIESEFYVGSALPLIPTQPSKQANQAEKVEIRSHKNYPAIKLRL